MADPKILNLDDLPVTTDKVLILKKVRHPLVPMSLGDFIEMTRTAETVSQVSYADAIQFMAGMVGRAFPSIPREDLMGMSLEQLNAVLAFAKDASVPTEAEGGPGNVTAGK